MSANYLLKVSPEEASIQINLQDNHQIQVEMLNAAKLILDYGDDYLTYNDLWSQVDLHLDLKENSVKETLILKDASAPREFYFKIKTKLKAIFHDNKVLFLDEQHILVYYIESPFIILNNGIIRADCNSVSHEYDSDSGIYTLRIAEFAEEFYPIKVDPTMIFPFYEHHYAQGYTISGQRNANIIITGSNLQKSLFDFSNKTVTPGMPNELHGSDQVTFHRNVHANLDFLVGANNTPELASITVSGEHKLTTMFNKRDIELNFNASLSPILLYVERTSTVARTYNFTLTFSESIRDFKDVSIESALVLNAEDLPLTNSIYGSITQAEKIVGSDTGYRITFTAPNNSPAEGYTLLRVKVDLQYTFGNETRSISRVLYAYIQYVNAINKNPFNFRNDAATTNTYNGDYYAPTLNRGFVILDASLGLVRTIDEHNGLTSEEDRNVFCVINVKDKGLLVCTQAGVYWYWCNPFDEPGTYEMPIRVSSKIIIHATMSMYYLFMLDEAGTVYRMGWKHFINILKRNPDIDDIADIYDPIWNSKDHQPFHQANYIDDGTAAYASPYNPVVGGLPTKLLPISVRAEYGRVSPTQADLKIDNVYFFNQLLKWPGIALVYKDKTTSPNRKTILSIAYSPIGDIKGANSGYGYTYLYDVVSEDNQDQLLSVPERESDLNRVVFASTVDTAPNGKYSINPIATPDKPQLALDWNIVGRTHDVTSTPESQQYNEALMYIPPSKFNSSKVLIGTVMPFNKVSLNAVSKTQPDNNKVYMSPQNVSIIDVVESGPYYNPITGEEIQ